MTRQNTTAISNGIERLYQLSLRWLRSRTNYLDEDFAVEMVARVVLILEAEGIPFDSEEARTRLRRYWFKAAGHQWKKHLQEQQRGAIPVSLADLPEEALDEASAGIYESVTSETVTEADRYALFQALRHAGFPEIEIIAFFLHITGASWEALQRWLHAQGRNVTMDSLRHWNDRLFNRMRQVLAQEWGYAF